MASNPLQIPVMGGGLDTPVAGVQVQTPMLSGPPVVQNRTISDIMSAISGVANAAGTIMQGEIQINKLSKEQKSELERNELAVWQRENDLWKLQAEINGPEVVQYDPSYQEFLVKLQKETSKEDRSPIYKAQAASMLQQQVGYLNSEQRMLDRDREQKQFRDEQRLEQSGRELWGEVRPYVLYKLADPNTTLEDIETEISSQYGDVEQVRVGMKNLMFEIKADRLKQQSQALEASAAEGFVNEAGILENIALTITNPRLDDPRQFDRAESRSKQAVSDLFKQKNGYDLISLSAINDKWDEVKEQFSLVKYPTDSQQTYMNAINAKFTEEYEQYANKMQADVYSKASSSINYKSRSSLFNPSSIKDVVVQEMNKQLGMDIISYQEGTGFTVNKEYGNLDELPIAASALEDKLMTEWDRNADQRRAWQQIFKAPVISDEVLKTAKFDIESSTLAELDFVSKKMRKGSDPGYFESFVKRTLTNPKLPDGSYDLEALQKTATIIDNMNIVQSVLLRDETSINDTATGRMIRLAVFSQLNKAKGLQAFSNLKERQLAGSVVGTTQSLVDEAFIENFVFGPSSIAGDKKDNKVEVTDNKSLFELYPGLVSGSPIMNALKYADRFYVLNNPKGFEGNKDIQKMYHKVILNGMGISMVNTGRGNFIPVADEYGHAPEAPLDIASKALNLVPEPGSPLHTSTLVKFSNSSAVVKDVETTKGMSIREIMNFYNKIDIKDKDLAVPGAASFPSGPSPLPSFAKGSETPIKSFSDYEYEDLFGYGVSVVNSFAGSEIKINSTLEKLMNDPLFGAEQKKASTKRAYDMIKKKNEENLNWWDKNIAGPTAFN